MITFGIDSIPQSGNLGSMRATEASFLPKATGLGLPSTCLYQMRKRNFRSVERTANAFVALATPRVFSSPLTKENDRVMKGRHSGGPSFGWFGKLKRLLPATAAYIRAMLSRVRNPRGRSSNGPPGFIRPCLSILANRLPDGPGWVHELKHDGYRLQIHIRDGRARLYTMNGNNWSDRYPRIIEAGAKIKGAAILDAEAVCLDAEGHPHFDTLHSRCADHLAVACAFDLLALDGDDLRAKPLGERKAALRRLLMRSRDGIQYVEHAEGHGDKLFEAVCKLGLEGIVSKRLGSPYRSGPSRAWIKVRNPKAPAANRIIDGTF